MTLLISSSVCLYATVLFCFKFLSDSNFKRFLQTCDLKITSQFPPHFTKATSLLETIWNLKQRMDYDFQSWIQDLCNIQDAALQPLTIITKRLILDVAEVLDLASDFMSLQFILYWNSIASYRTKEAATGSVS